MKRFIFVQRCGRFGVRKADSLGMHTSRIHPHASFFLKVIPLTAFLLSANIALAQDLHKNNEGVTSPNTTNVWVPLEPKGIRAKERVSWQKLVYDENNDKIWLFACAGGETYQAYANDVWLYDLATNVWTMVHDISPDRDPADQPSWRHSEQGRTFDSSLGLIVLFGQQSSVGPKNDTWTYKISTEAWTEKKPSGDVPPIPNHFEYALEYDRNARVSVLFGGERQWSYPSDVWEYNLVRNGWKRYPFSTLNAPKGRRGHGMVYCDSLRGNIVFGGGYGWSTVVDFNDTWLYKAAPHSWKRLRNVNPPPARRQFNFDYDPFNNICLLFSGGIGEGTISQLYSDTWVYHVAQGRWEELASTIHPPAEGRGDMMVFARKHKAFFLMSGDGNIWKFQYTGMITDIQAPRRLPFTHELLLNFPNPFNPSTKIEYRVSSTRSPDDRVQLRIFDLMGRHVLKLVDQFQASGEYNIEWDGKNTQGQAMPSGIYICELRIGEFKRMKKMSLIR